jgi:hypothetical protein
MTARYVQQGQLGDYGDRFGRDRVAQIRGREIRGDRGRPNNSC